ncbi:unnamed protein product [Symbiodinium sp. CCMP2592]|nr:unnamed protein product [Symbiodinium sp. CCMP2592]
MGRPRKDSQKEQSAPKRRKSGPERSEKDIKKEKEKSDRKPKVKKERAPSEYSSGSPSSESGDDAPGQPSSTSQETLQQMENIGLAFGLKPKLLQVKRAQLHLSDLSGPQLATVLSGVVPELTPLRLLKLGGEIVQVRKSISEQWKQQTAGRKDNTDLDAKIDMVKKEASAERVWKQRLFTIFDTVLGVSQLMIIRQHTHLAPIQQLLRVEWQQVPETTKKDRRDKLSQQIAEWDVEVTKEMDLLNQVTSPPPKDRSSRGRRGRRLEEEDISEKSPCRESEGGKTVDGPCKQPVGKKKINQSLSRDASLGAESRAGAMDEDSAAQDDDDIDDDDNDIFGNRFKGKKEQPKQARLTPPPRPVVPETPKLETPKLETPKLETELPETSLGGLTANACRPSWIGLLEDDLKLFFKRDSDKQIFGYIICADGLNSSLEDFMEEAFGDGEHYSLAALGREAKVLAGELSFMGKKSFDKCCAWLSEHKDRIPGHMTLEQQVTTPQTPCPKSLIS